MKNILIALCWLASLGVLSLHAESFHSLNGNENLSAGDAADLDSGSACCSSAPADNSPPQVFAALNFSSPLHVAGQKPATGDSGITPAGLTGNPQVVAATPVLQHQPLVLNSDLINGPCCYEEGIQVLVHDDAQHYLISFDLASEQLDGSFNQFQLWLNGDSAPLLRFQSDHLVMVEGVGAVAGFHDNQLLHVQVWLDLEQQQLTLRINNQHIYQGQRALASLQSLQFLMTIEGGATPEQVNPEARVALDNIVVSNGSFGYANLQTHVQRTAPSDARQDTVEFATTISNISAHAAHDVVITQLLPEGSRVAAIDSSLPDCEVTEQQVLCRTASLGAMEQIQVNLALNVAKEAANKGLTVIATSATDEIDNHDNQMTVRVGGSGSLLLLLALLALWLLRVIERRQ